MTGCVQWSKNLWRAALCCTLLLLASSIQNVQAGEPPLSEGLPALEGLAVLDRELNPLKQPRPSSTYGMDILGPSWQWIFPREEAYPRLSGPMRVDQMDEVMRKSAAAGVRWARLAAWWCILEPAQDRFEWRDLDITFQIASNYGIVPVPEILFTPEWAATGGASGTPCIHSDTRKLPPRNMADWSDFMNRFVRRYGVYGVDQVHEFEIWNEPDLWEFLYVPQDPFNANVTVYAELVKRARRAIDQHDIGGRLLLGGMSDINGPEFIGRLLDLRGALDIRDDVDVVTFHAFSAHGLKIDRLRAPILERGLPYELWVNELNDLAWDENVTPALLAQLHQLLRSRHITNTFWFTSWTTDWGPGIFYNRDPLWVSGAFVPNPFYDVFKNQAFPHQLPAAPGVEWPPANLLVNPRPSFVWRRPQQGSFPIAGYKLQLDNSLYRGQPYFHTPEVDVWVPATHIHFFPLQMSGRRSAHASGQEQAVDYAPQTPAQPVPALGRVVYVPAYDLPAGVYYWRVAAVDVEGNVGPYTAPRRIAIGSGLRRAYTPWMRR